MEATNESGDFIRKWNRYELKLPIRKLPFHPMTATVQEQS